MQKSLPLVILLLLGAIASHSQELSRPSPLAIASIRVKETYLKITYSQPKKRGREIFGNLVPYGQIWRMGANEAAEITLTKDILMQGTILKAGTYSLFSIPQKDKWTIIINQDLGLWGAYNYNVEMDIMRFDIPVQISDKFYESFTMTFSQRNDSADLLIAWDRLNITVPIKFTN